MTVLLPLLAAALLFVLHLRRDRHRREATVDAAITWGLLAVACSEGLSPFRAFTPAGVAAFWGVVLVALCVALRHPNPAPPPSVSPQRGPGNPPVILDPVKPGSLR